ncbi:MAG: hypothetical protein V4585_09765 [Bacteroidota bacterium]
MQTNYIKSKSIKEKVYKFVIHEDVFIITNIKNRSFNNCWLSIEPDGKITLNGSYEDGYAWDGCSPKVVFLDITWGTPDGKLDWDTEAPITYYASLIHDVLYQFKGDIPISKKEADILFLLNLRKTKFKLAGIYGFAVRVLGGLYGKWKTQKSQSKINIEEFSWI